MASGYHGAPVTKLLTCVVVGLSLLASSPRLGSSSEWLPLESRDQIVRAGEVWRLLSSQWFAGSFASCLVQVMLLYRFRTFERLMGSPRFSMFVLLTCVWAAASRGVLVLAGGPLTARGFSSGPLELVFALMVYFARAWGRHAWARGCVRLLHAAAHGCVRWAGQLRLTAACAVQGCAKPAPPPTLVPHPCRRGADAAPLLLQPVRPAIQREGLHLCSVRAAGPVGWPA